MALKSVAVQVPDLILLDIKMPEMDGYEICRRLKANPHSRSVPVIFISSYRETAKQVEGFEAGGVDFISKPFESKEVLARIQTHLRLHELTERLEQQVSQRTRELRQEIFERKQTETELRKSENRFRRHSENLEALFNSTPSILMLVNAEGRIEKMNRSAAACLAKEAKETCGQLGDVAFNCVNAFHAKGCGLNPEYKQCPIRRRLISTFETGRTHFEEEGQMRLPLNGKERTLDFLISTTLLKIDGSDQVLLSLTDITELKRTKEKLHESEELHHSILRMAMDGFLIADAQGQILKVNESYCKMSGYSEEELLRMRIVDLVVNRTADYIADRSKRIMARGQERFVTQHRRKDGRIIDLEVNAQHHTDLGDRIVCFLRDITEQKKMEARMQQAQKMESIGNLAGGIAHDFNNILSAVIGMAELMLEDLPRRGKLYENTREILIAGKRGCELVKQILAFSRQSEHELIPIQAQQVIEEVLKLTRATIPSYIDIKQEIQQDCGVLMADPTQIHQVAMNIITNAFHAVESQGGTITVELKETQLDTCDLHGSSIEPGRYALISISDTGHGMSADQLSKIFDPYFTTKGQGKGTGLGLAVAYGIINEHKGEIKVYSEVGKGTTFRIYLPLMESPVVTEPVDEAEHDPTGNERILLVDDEASVAKVEKMILERLGYRVVSHVNCLDALETFKATPRAFDLLITDMNMPNMTGDQLTSKIKSIRPDMPVILCTGFSEKISREKTANVDINGFLMKPIVKSDMAHAVRKVLDRAKARNEKQILFKSVIRPL